MTKQEREIIFDWLSCNSVSADCANHWGAPQTEEEIEAEGACEECRAHRAMSRLMVRVEIES